GSRVVRRVAVHPQPVDRGQPIADLVHHRGEVHNGHPIPGSTSGRSSACTSGSTRDSRTGPLHSADPNTPSGESFRLYSRIAWMTAACSTTAGVDGHPHAAVTRTRAGHTPPISSSSVTGQPRAIASSGCASTRAVTSVHEVPPGVLV